MLCVESTHQWYFVGIIHCFQDLFDDQRALAPTLSYVIARNALQAPEFTDRTIAETHQKVLK